MAPWVPNQDEYAQLFDRFEYTLGVQYSFVTWTEENGYRRGPVGRFAYRLAYPAGNGVAPLRAEIEAHSDATAPDLQAAALVVVENGQFPFGWST